jgi:hypothetical protein
MPIQITLVEEKEITGEDCTYCKRPFWLDVSNKETALEFDNGMYYMHKQCAISHANNILKHAK